MSNIKINPVKIHPMQLSLFFDSPAGGYSTTPVGNGTSGVRS